MLEMPTTCLCRWRYTVGLWKDTSHFSLRDVYWRMQFGCDAHLVPSISAIIHSDKIKLPYFPAHKTHRDFFVRNFRKKNYEYILILVIHWKETGLLHTKISNHSIIYSS